MFEIVDWEKSKIYSYLTKEEYDAIQLPKRSTKYSCGYDFISPVDITLHPGTKYLLPTGIKVNFSELENSSSGNSVYYLALYPRSSYGFKYGFNLLNTVGIIDQDYYNNEDNDGHILIGVTVDEKLVINKGDKICQGVICTSPLFKNDVVNTVRTGGIGSTGKR